MMDYSDGPQGMADYIGLISSVLALSVAAASARALFQNDEGSTCIVLLVWWEDV